MFSLEFAFPQKQGGWTVFLDEFVFNFDVIMVTETWCSANTEIFNRGGYQSFFLNRQHKQGRGLEVLVKRELECEVDTQFSIISQDIECLTLLSREFFFHCRVSATEGTNAKFH